jgi:hypothetical protein
MGQGVPRPGEVNRYTRVAEGKPNLRSLRGRGCARLESGLRYPKPADLFLGRLKPFERGVEDRSGADVQIARVTWV